MKTSKQIFWMAIGAFSLALYIDMNFQYCFAYHNFFFRDAGDIVTGILDNNRIDPSSVTKLGPNPSGNSLLDNSVGGRELGNRVVLSTHIGDNAISGSNLAAGIILSSHVGSLGSLTVNPYTVVVGTSATGLNANVNFVTTDQTGFAMAIDSLGVTNGGVLRVRRGTYTFTGTLESSANITIECEDGAVLMPSGATVKVLSTSGTIRGCTFSSGGQAVNYTGAYLLMVNSSGTAENITISNSKLTHPVGTYDAPIILSGWHPVLKNLKVRKTDFFGSLASKSLVKFAIANNAVWDGGDIDSTHANSAADTLIGVMDSSNTLLNKLRIVSGSDLNYTFRSIGILNTASSGTVLTNSYFEANGNGDSTGIIALDFARNMKISNCTFVQRSAGPLGTVFGLAGTGVSSGTFILDNTFLNWGTVANISASGNNVILHGNVATNITTFISDSGSGTKFRDNMVNDAWNTDQ